MIFELESTECELSLADTVKQFDSGKGDGGGVEVLETSIERVLDLMPRCLVGSTSIDGELRMLANRPLLFSMAYRVQEQTGSQITNQCG